MHLSTYNLPQKHNTRNYPDFSGYGWIIVICGFILYLIVDGIAYNLGLVNSAWLVEFKQSETATSWIGSIFYSVPLLSAPITAQLVEKFGCKMITIVCGIISTCGFIISSFCESIEQLYVSVGLIAGFGVSAAYIVGILSAERWFEKHRTLAIGIVSSGTGFGTFVIAPITQRLLDVFGWRQTMYFLASLNVLMSIVGCFIKDPPWIREEKEKQMEAAGSENFGYFVEKEVNYGTWKRKQSIPEVEDLKQCNTFQNGGLKNKNKLIKIDDVQFQNNVNDIQVNSEHLKTANTTENESSTIVFEDCNEVKIVYEQRELEVNSDVNKKLEATNDNSNLNLNNCGNMDMNNDSYERGNFQNGVINFHAEHASPPDYQTWKYVNEANRSNTNIENSCDSTTIPSDPLERHENIRPKNSQINLKIPSNHQTISSSSIQSQNTIRISPSTQKSLFTIIQRFLKKKLRVIKKLIVTSFSHFSNRNFTLLAISTFAIYALYNVPMFFIIELLRTYGYNEAQCANYISIIGFSLLVGMVTLGYIGDVSGDHVKNVNALCVLICGIAESLLPTCAENSIAFGICCIVFGFSFASAYVLIPKIAEMIVGSADFASAIGLNFFVQGCALLVGIPFASTIYENIGSWKISFEICGAIIATGSIFAYFTKVKKD